MTPSSHPVLTPNAWLRYDIIRRRIDSVRPLGSILEIGIGQGSMGARLARLARYVGVEQDRTSREVARQRLPDAAVVVPELDDVDTARRFDLVCAFEVLEHIEDDVGTLRAWTQRLRPGGHVLLSVPAHARRFSGIDRLVGHYRRYDPSELVTVAREAGLTDVETDCYGFPLGYVLELGQNMYASRRMHERTTMAKRTAGSGRHLQPPTWAAAVTQVGTAPFRLMQWPLRKTNLGTGLVLFARCPDPYPA
jgi:SAM-dependent methyltransferase